VVELVDEPDLAPPGLGALAVRGMGEIDTAEPHGAAVGGIEKARDMQKRRLACPRGGHERHRLAGTKREGRTLEHPHLAGGADRVAFRDVVEVESHLIHSAKPRQG